MADISDYDTGGHISLKYLVTLHVDQKCRAVNCHVFYACKNAFMTLNRLYCSDKFSSKKLSTDVRKSPYNLPHLMNRGYYMVARRYEYYFRVGKNNILRTSTASE